MEDFTGGAIQNQPARRISTLGPEWDARVRQFVAEWGANKNPELIEEMIVTALKMARDEMGVADLKLINRSLKEMRYAAKVFAHYSEFRKVAVFGSARIPPEAPEFQVAESFARRMVKENYMVITGGGEGIMGAAQRGAGREDSFGLNIRLPFEQRANIIIEGDSKLINFNYFFTRKLNFVKETHAFALFPGGFGTMDEVFELLTLMQTGKARVMPVVLLDRPGGSYWETWMRFLTDHLLKARIHFVGRFSPVQNRPQRRAGGGRDPAILQNLQFGSVGRRTTCCPDLSAADEEAVADLEREIFRSRSQRQDRSGQRAASGKKRI